MQTYIFLIIFAFLNCINIFYIYTGEYIFINLIISIITGMMYVGVLELIHQCTHNNAFHLKIENTFWGIVLSILIHFNFDKYKKFHLNHHKYVGTNEDPERSLYKKRNNPYVQLILAPLFFYKFAYYVNTYKEGKNGYSALVFIYFIAMIIIAIFNISYFIFIYIIPFLVFTYLDFLFNQAEHYGFFEKDYSNKDRIIDANNIEIPFFLGYIFLFRNYHQLHHKFPKIKWYNTYKFYVEDFSKRKYCKNEKFFSFLKKYLNSGIRVWESKIK